ncbi:unnamed protein product [Darwinula stevensoni]|uniref:Uncharacterized protein n=1 Tax=Darwinula stevensoni TaxID=69355 RepID=A0A7R8X476_9CRUS|nr:unnamed protein product [Darwinula stevensoni]CAG0879393.1 unnamed protein product [Darwinula stevensoni]
MNYGPSIAQEEHTQPEKRDSAAGLEQVAGATKATGGGQSACNAVKPIKQGLSCASRDHRFTFRLDMVLPVDKFFSKKSPSACKDAADRRRRNAPETQTSPPEYGIPQARDEVFRGENDAFGTMYDVHQTSGLDEDEGTTGILGRSQGKMPTSMVVAPKHNRGYVNNFANSLECLERDMKYFRGKMELLEESIATINRTAWADTDRANRGEAWIHGHDSGRFSEGGLTVSLGSKLGLTGRPGIWKILWICVLCASITITIIQTRGLILNFMRNPSAQDIRIVRPNGVDFPAVTVCPGSTWNKTALRLYNLTKNDVYVYGKGFVLNRLNMSLDEALYFFSMNDLSFVTSCIAVLDCQGNATLTLVNAGKWKELRFAKVGEDSLVKVCYTFRANTTMELGTSSAVMEFNFTFQDFERVTYFEVHIHPQDEPFTDGLRGVPTSRQTLLLGPGSRYTLSVSPKSYLYLPRGQECNADKDYNFVKVISCVAGAVKEEFLKGGPCVLPAMLPEDETSHKSLCNNSEDLDQFLDFYHDVEELFIPDCLRKCNRTTYNMLLIPETPLDMPMKLMPTVHLELNTPISDMEIVEELETTSVYQFLSDMGGMIGLYFGFSFLTIYECLEFLFVYATSRIARAHVRP